MILKRSSDIPRKPVAMEGAIGCRVQILVGNDEQALNFVMRQFEVAPGGHTPRHFHDYEHEIFVVQGSGVVVDGNKELTLEQGDVIYVAPNDVHQFKNTGDGPLKFLCLIPNAAADKSVTVIPECGLG